MATKKITDLVEITTAASDDVLPIVDVSLDITNKITTTNLLKGKQDLLESGTNIKTINSTSLLGSGDISISANPSGGAGLIQFSDGSAFASDSNLFWDNVNKILTLGGLGVPAQIDLLRASNGGRIGYIKGESAGVLISSSNGAHQVFVSNNGIGIGTFIATAKTHIKGSGSTSATTALLVQNSAGTELLKVQDNGTVSIGTRISTSVVELNYVNTAGGAFSVMQTNISNGNARFYQFVSVGKTTDPVASAALEVNSTTRGFLPPRMTTTQKNAISSPASGLMVYDTSTNKLCCFNGTSWNDLF